MEWILCKNNPFQGSEFGRRLLTTSFPRKALLCSAGSINPRPPSKRGRVTTNRATLALVDCPSPPKPQKIHDHPLNLADTGARENPARRDVPHGG